MKTRRLSTSCVQYHYWIIYHHDLVTAMINNYNGCVNSSLTLQISKLQCAFNTSSKKKKIISFVFQQFKSVILNSKCDALINFFQAVYES